MQNSNTGSSRVARRLEIRSFSSCIPLMVWLAAGLLGGSGAAAQEKPPAKKPVLEMNVDMPDETQETDLVDKGQWQLETSLLYNRYKQDKSSFIGQGLLRYGLAGRVELRLLVEDGRQRDTYITKTVQSTYPMAIGAKVSLVKDVKGLPDITLVSYVKLPFTSRSGEQKAYWSPIVLAAFQNKFAGDRVMLEYNIGGQQEAYGTEWAVLVNASLHYKLLERLELFTEYYSQFQPGKDPQHNVGGGLACQVSNALELYVSAGGSLLYHPSNHYFEGGVAVRIP